MSAESSYSSSHGVEFLDAQIKSILAFYDPVCADVELGGFHNQLRDDGTVYDRNRKHCVGTARYTVNYSLATLLYGKAEHKELAAHGVSFLMDRQQDSEHGGFIWILNGRDVEDGEKWCYSVAFSLLALANAHRAGVEGALAHITTVHALAEERYFEPSHGLYIDSFPMDFSAANTYRGQNANMHMCEAHLALYEALGERFHLERATAIAHKLVVALPTAAGCFGRVIEHYSSAWAPDPEKNRGADPNSEEYIFRPYGFQPGHSFEWAKLIILLERHHREAKAGTESTGWMLPAAELLFRTACECGWDKERGGVYYTFDDEGLPLDKDKYYWALAEMIASAGLLGHRTGAVEYWAWYDKAWDYAEHHFIDGERGGWYPMMSPENVRTDTHAGPEHTGLPVKCYPSKTDYHPLAACYEVLRALTSG